MELRSVGARSSRLARTPRSGATWYGSEGSYHGALRRMTVRPGRHAAELRGTGASTVPWSSAPCSRRFASDATQRSYVVRSEGSWRSACSSTLELHAAELRGTVRGSLFFCPAFFCRCLSGSSGPGKTPTGKCRTGISRARNRGAPELPNLRRFLSSTSSTELTPAARLGARSFLARTAQSAAGHLAVALRAVDAQIASIEFPGHDRGRAAPQKGIENQAAGRRAREDAGFDQRLGKYGEVGVAKLAEWNRPHTVSPCFSPGDGTPGPSGRRAGSGFRRFSLVRGCRCAEEMRSAPPRMRLCSEKVTCGSRIASMS